MFKNKFNLLIGLIIIGFAILGIYEYANKQRPKQDKKTPTVGIILPMDHVALREIVEGLKQSLSQDLSYPVTIKVQNAQGDLNLQHSIIQQLINEKVDVLIPVGTAATQMTISMAHNQPIVSLAALYTEQDKETDKKSNITRVLDEIGPEKPLNLMKETFSGLKKISLIYSNTEKVFPDVETLTAYALSKGIQLQKIMIQSLPDLYTVSHRIDEDSGVIFILKDHLIVSGIQTVVQQAQKRKIPVVSCDEGSVQEGAAFSLGVKEKSIGIAGGEVVAKVLNGTPARDILVSEITKLSVFYNPQACEAQGVDLMRLKQVANDHQYELVNSGTL